jgi:AbrB family looped-hinge helix DNA binding protein
MFYAATALLAAKKDSLFLRETGRGISLWQYVYKVTCELVIVEIVRLGKDGRITIPARLRRNLEIKKGAVFIVECSEQGLVLRPVPRLVDATGSFLKHAKAERV